MYYKRAGTEDLDQAVSEDLTPSQYRAAELGYFGLLRRKRMSRQFIERNAENLFAQALYEYVRSIRAGKEIRKPVAWIVLCAWSRTIRVLEQPNWRPSMVSTERVGEISADRTPAPEEELLSEDRYRKIREAVERLPAYQRELLAVSYFEGESVREAARKLGWTPSKAQRAHEAAQRRLRKLLGVESSDELEIAAGLAAFLSFGPDGCARALQLIGGFEGAVDPVAHHLSQLGERVLDLLRRPFTHGGPAGHAPARSESLGDLGRRAVVGADHGPTALIARGGRRVPDLGRRILASGAIETTTAAADGGARFAEACKIAAVCLIGTGAIAGGSALLDSTQHHRPAPRPDRSAASSRHRALGAPAPGEPESAQPPVAVPSGSKEHAAASNSGTDSSNAASSGNQPSPARRRAQRHKTEESTTDTAFEAGSVAAAEEEEWRASGSSSGASASAEPTHTTSAATTETPVANSASPKVQAEEKQTKTQFQGGLP